MTAKFGCHASHTSTVIFERCADTDGKYIMPTKDKARVEEINVTTADNVDKLDEIKSKYNVPNMDKDMVEEIIQ